MSDAPQGEGWWQASDGKWYPPEQPPPGYWQAADGRWYPPQARAPHRTGEAAAGTKGNEPLMKLLIAAGAAGMLLGLFMSWASIGPFSVDGIDTDDGKLYLVLALCTCGVVAVLLVKWFLQGLAVATTVLGVIGAAFAILEMATVGDDSEAIFEVSVGAGLYVNLIGSVALTAGAIWALAASRTRQ